MLRRLLPLILVSVPALAEASAYETFLKRLEEKTSRLQSGGWTSRDVQDLSDEVAGRPAADPSAYVPFVRVLANVVKSVEPGGVISKEIEVTRIVASVKPDGARGRVHHEAFLRAFADQLVRASAGGVISKEIELAQIVAGVAPNPDVPPRGYEGAYAAWSTGLGQVEKAFARGGLISNEKKLLDLYRSLQPQRGAAPAAPPPVAEPSAASGQERFCGRFFDVQERIERRRRGVVILTRDGDAIAIDDCNQWWLAGGITSMTRLGRQLVLLGDDGVALLVDGNHGVHRLARRVARVEPDGRRAARLVRRNGKSETVEVAREPAGGNHFAVDLGGRRKLLPRLYDSTRRKIRGR